jgi:hypothetical protein
MHGANNISLHAYRARYTVVPSPPVGLLQQQLFARLSSQFTATNIIITTVNGPLLSLPFQHPPHGASGIAGIA